MKRFLVLVLLLGLAVTVCEAAPTINEANRIKFTIEGQSTSVKFAISSISWVSASGDEIGGTGGFILNDESGVDIASCEATTISDQCHFTFVEPLVVQGLEVEHLDGDLYVYGKRR